MLTEKKIKALKVTDRAYKAGDQRGLYILVKPSGARSGVINIESNETVNQSKNC